MSLPSKKVKDNIDKDHLVGLLRHLIQVESYSPPGNEDAIAEILALELDAAGVPVEMQAVKPGRSNLLARIGSQSGPTLMFNAHMDTVPAGDLSQWSAPPFSGELRDGRIIGRGAVDDKGGLAAMTTALITLQSLKVPLAGGLLFTAVMGEEVGHIGTAHLLRSGVQADMAIVGEWSSAGQIALGYRGRVEARLSVKGRSAHGSRPEHGLNAIDLMADRVLPAIKQLSFPHTVSGIFVAPHPTLAVTMIEGGVRPNMIPDHCSATLDMRLVTGQKAEDVCRDIETAAQTALQDVPGAEIAVDFEGATSPFLTSQDTELVRALSQSVEEVTGSPARYFAKSGTSDANLIADQLGIPVVAYGPGNTTGHAADEFIEVADLIAACEVYVLTAARLLSG